VKLTTLEKEKEINAFAIEASSYFGKNKKKWTYTSGEVEEACFFATRWGSGDCVMVFKLDEYFEPVIFQQSIDEAKNDTQ
jgi:hypothetical protein